LLGGGTGWDAALFFAVDEVNVIKAEFPVFGFRFEQIL